MKTFFDLAKTCQSVTMMVKTSDDPIISEMVTQPEMPTLLIHALADTPDVPKIDQTDMLYLDTINEGNYKAMELGRYANEVAKYIVITNTTKYAHYPDPVVKLNGGVTSIGLTFGINHFLQVNDPWFIKEHHEDSGITILERRTS